MSGVGPKGPIVRLDDRYRWPLTIGLAAVVAAGAGAIAAQDVVGAINPFYANIAAREGVTAEPEIVATSFVEPSNPPVVTTDLSYGRGGAMADGDGSGEMR